MSQSDMEYGTSNRTGFSQKVGGKVTGVVGASRDRVASVAQQTGAQAESHPLAVLAGGLAIGAIAGALLPRTERERQALAPVGKRLATTAAAAASAAREAGKQQFAQLSPQEAAKQRVAEVFQQVVSAAKTSGKQAATGSEPQG